MVETIYVLFKVQFDFALEVWFSIFKEIAYMLKWCGYSEEVSHSNYAIYLTRR